MDQQAQENLEEALVDKAKRKIAHESAMSVGVALSSLNGGRDSFSDRVWLDVRVLIEGQLKIVFSHGDRS